MPHREDAQDLTQDFFLRALQWKLFRRIAIRGEHGSGPSFEPVWIGSLAMSSETPAAQKRGGGIIFLPIDVGEIEADLLANGNPDSDPDQTFQREMDSQPVHAGGGRARAPSASAAGKAVQFSVFERADLLAGRGVERPSLS